MKNIKKILGFILLLVVMPLVAYAEDVPVAEVNITGVTLDYKVGDTPKFTAKCDESIINCYYETFRKDGTEEFASTLDNYPSYFKTFEPGKYIYEIKIAFIPGYMADEKTVFKINGKVVKNGVYVDEYGFSLPSLSLKTEINIKEEVKKEENKQVKTKEEKEQIEDIVTVGPTDTDDATNSNSLMKSYEVKINDKTYNAILPEEIIQKLDNADSSDVVINMTVQKLSEEENKKQEDLLKKDSLLKNYNILTIVDINIPLYIKSEKQTDIHEFEDKIDVTVPSTILENIDITKKQEYKWVRIHDGKVEFVDSLLANGDYLLKSDKFSIYALVEKKDNSNSLMPYMLGVIAGISAVGVYRVITNNKRKK